MASTRRQRLFAAMWLALGVVMLIIARKYLSIEDLHLATGGARRYVEVLVATGSFFGGLALVLFGAKRLVSG